MSVNLAFKPKLTAGPKLPRPKLPAWTREIGWRTLVGGALLGGVIHICATFAAPVVGTGNAFQRLRAILPLNQMVVLPAPLRASRSCLIFNRICCTPCAATS
ncbi:MAG: hypothetical protein HC869_11760 [Rhodospirillales bacterium]|nr:hypothetical protein [Rhodospirillales bacterium]